MVRFSGVLLGLFCLTAQAQSIEVPTYKTDDTWVYVNTTERGSSEWSQVRNEIRVNRVTANNLYLSIKNLAANQPVRNLVVMADWRFTRNIDGKETVIAQPMSFPLSVGKRWTVDYTEPKPSKAFKSRRWVTEHSVVGIETVEVLGGKFTAYKIEVEGHWYAEFEPSQSVVQGAQTGGGNAAVFSQAESRPAKTAAGHIYKAIWYAPEVKRWVKFVEEFYSPDGTRQEKFTDELMSYKLAE